MSIKRGHRSDRDAKLLTNRPMVTHLLQNGNQSMCGLRHPACSTNAVENVTCGRCRRSVAALSRGVALMGQPMKGYELIVTTVQEQTITVTAADPAEAMFEAGRMAASIPGRVTDQYMKLQEMSEKEWAAAS